MNRSHRVPRAFTPVQMWTCCLLGALSIIPSSLAFYIFQFEPFDTGDHREMACHVVSPVPDGWTVLLLLAQVGRVLQFSGVTNTVTCFLDCNKTIQTPQSMYRMCCVVPDGLLDPPVLRVLRWTADDHRTDDRHAPARTCMFV